MENKEENLKKVISESTAKELDLIFEEREKNSIEKVEAALFISGRFLSMNELIMLTDVNPVMLNGILNNLEKKYSNGVIRLINRSESWKMDVAPEYHYMINKLATGNAEFTKAEQDFGSYSI